MGNNNVFYINHIAFTLLIAICVGACSKAKEQNVIVMPVDSSDSLPQATNSARAHVAPPAQPQACNAGLATSDPAPSFPGTGSVATIDFGATLQINALGGALPLTYQMVSGDGAISSTGLFRGASSGDSIIQVIDAACRSAQTKVTVRASTLSQVSINDSVYSLPGVSSYYFGLIEAKKAWSVQTDCHQTPVAIIDTGIDLGHPDLVGNLWQHQGEIPGDGIDNDGNGYVDDVNGWNFGDDTNVLTDQYFHGTHVAGIIGAAGNNGQGVSGLCWKASIMPLRVADSSGRMTSSSVVEAVYYAAGYGAKVINISLGTYTYIQALSDAIAYAGQFGTLVVAAAGNDGKNLETSPMYPASFPLDNIITVGSTGATDQPSSFSNYGVKSVDLAAPGETIWSTTPMTQTSAMKSQGIVTQYDYLDGTSMAAPFVTGALAAVWSSAPELTAVQLKDRILRTTDKISALSTKNVSGGRLNLRRAINPGSTP